MPEDGKGRENRIQLMGWAIAIVVLLAGGAVVAFSFFWSSDETQAEAPAAPLVRVASPVELNQPLTISQTALVRSGTEVVLAPEVGGRIERIGENFAAGGRLAEGDLVIELDDARFRSDLQAAQAAVEEAEASLDEARADLDRQNQLAERGATPEATTEDAAARVKRARASLSSARAQRQSAEIALDDTRLEAPFPAVVLSADAARGQLVSAGTSVGTAALAGYAEAAVGLSERDFALLGGEAALLGKPVGIRPVRAEGEVKDVRIGTVTAVIPRIESSARTTEVIVSIRNPFAADEGATALRIGEVVRVHFALPDEESPFAAPSGVVQAGQQVWGVDSDNRLVRLEAEVRRRIEGAVLLSGDLEGRRLLLTPVDTPVDGLKVRVDGDKPVTVGDLSDPVADRIASAPSGLVDVPDDIASGAASSAAGATATGGNNAAGANTAGGAAQ
ncbi:efflux RND transporter periplasmic adaptor subunit [Martelella sp. FLE1502]